jgi:hypothetical protein
MHFFDEVPLFQITQTMPVRTWNLAGYKEFNIHGWFRGQPGARVHPEVYFNNMGSWQNTTVTIPIAAATGAVQPVAVWTATIPVYAPEVSLVLIDPSAPMDSVFRIYAACCPEPLPWFRNIWPLKRIAEVRVLPTDPAVFKPDEWVDPESR